MVPIASPQAQCNDLTCGRIKTQVDGLSENFVTTRMFALETTPTQICL